MRGIEITLFEQARYSLSRNQKIFALKIWNLRENNLGKTTKKELGQWGLSKIGQEVMTGL